ncbi:hypothetical protein [Streptomyces sp. NPDC047009]|uniref:hypothetical protein n=1 Tax=Streptomyces sp. NPDC047009 TaxID=3154496 RepID=UPI0033F08681
MPQDGPERATREVYLLFAHEAYYPAAAQEINTSLVAAASLLHPHVRQPDGARIYDRLTHGRRPGEIVPLSTLTHELDGGALWPQLGDWEASPWTCSSSSAPATATPSAWTCRTSPVPWRAPAPQRGADLRPGGRTVSGVRASRPHRGPRRGREATGLGGSGGVLWPGDGLLAPVNPEEAT